MDKGIDELSSIKKALIIGGLAFVGLIGASIYFSLQNKK